MAIDYRRLLDRSFEPVEQRETIRTEIWRSDAAIAFRCRVPERDVTVIDNGHAVVD